MEMQRPQAVSDTGRTESARSIEAPAPLAQSPVAGINEAPRPVYTPPPAPAPEPMTQVETRREPNDQKSE